MQNVWGFIIKELPKDIPANGMYVGKWQIFYILVPQEHVNMYRWKPYSFEATLKAPPNATHPETGEPVELIDFDSWVVDMFPYASTDLSMTLEERQKYNYAAK